jgi:hypothetical protein
MQQKTLLASKPWITVLLMVAVVSFFGCGTGSEISMTGGTTADQSAVLAAVETEPFFTESITDTDEDNEAAAEAQAQIYDGQVAIESLSSEAGTAELPRFWWRGDLERLGREIDIHIEDNVARVTVVHDVAGTFYIADTTGDALYLWGKPFEDMVTRHAEFLKTAKGWILTAISPVQFTLAESNIQTVAIEAVRAFSGDELVWEATDPSTLYTVTGGETGTSCSMTGPTVTWSPVTGFLPGFIRSVRAAGVTSRQWTSSIRQLSWKLKLPTTVLRGGCPTLSNDAAKSLFDNER